MAVGNMGNTHRSQK